MFCVYAPSNQGQMIVGQLQAKNPPGVYTAATIKVRMISIDGKFRSMGVTTYKDGLVMLNPLCVHAFYLMAFSSAFGRAAGFFRPITCMNLHRKRIKAKDKK